MNMMVEWFRRSAFGKFLMFGVPLFALMAAPLAASAQVQGYDIWKVPPGYWAPNGIVSCTGQYPIGTNGTQAGTKYCTSLADLEQTFVNAVYLLMSIALFVIAPILFLVGAIMMIASSGNPEMIGRARKTMMGAVIGVVIVLCAYLIVNTVITTLNITGVGGFGTP